MSGPHYTDSYVTLWHGDCVDVMRGMPDVSVDAICTDPPYSYAFMSRAWDSHETPHAFQAWCETWAREALRVLRPGGHMLAFGGTRTHHRLTCAIEDAGFEIRDSITWIYGSGFPKSLDVGKAIDRDAGVEREVLRERTYKFTDGGGYSGNLNTSKPRSESAAVTAPATDAARQWNGWGTALKPASEPIVVARKPLTGTVANNVMRWGTGALNIGATRVATSDDLNGGAYTEGRKPRAMNPGGLGQTNAQPSTPYNQPTGRWPSNIVLTHAESCTDRCVDGCPVRELDRQSGVSRDGVAVNRNRGERLPSAVPYVAPNANGPDVGYGGEGGASRFFPTFKYEAKAPSQERPRVGDTAHATVKPLDLMRWLVRLVTPPNGTVLDMFAGSGTTLEAAMLEGFNSIGIEQDADYLPLIAERIRRAKAQGHQPDLFGGAA